MLSSPLPWSYEPGLEDWIVDVCGHLNYSWTCLIWFWQNAVINQAQNSVGKAMQVPAFNVLWRFFSKRHLYGIFCTGKIYISNVNKDIAKVITIYWDLKLFSYEL